MIQQIINTVGEVLKSEVNVDTSQKNCHKWDSLMQIHIAIALEAAFDIFFEPNEIAEMIDIRSIEQTIKTKITY